MVQDHDVGWCMMVPREARWCRIVPDDSKGCQHYEHKMKIKFRNFAKDTSQKNKFMINL